MWVCSETIGLKAAEVNGAIAFTCLRFLPTQEKYFRKVFSCQPVQQVNIRDDVNNDDEPLRLNVVEGIDGFAVFSDFEVEVVYIGSAGAEFGDGLAFFDGFAFCDQAFFVVAVGAEEFL